MVRRSTPSIPKSPPRALISPTDARTAVTLLLRPSFHRVRLGLRDSNLKPFQSTPPSSTHLGSVRLLKRFPRLINSDALSGWLNPNRPGQTASKTFIVVIVMKEFPASIAPGDDVIDGVWVLKSRQTWHRAIDPTGLAGKLNLAYEPLTPYAIPNPESDPGEGPLCRNPETVATGENFQKPSRDRRGAAQRVIIATL